MQFILFFYCLLSLEFEKTWSAATADEYMDDILATTLQEEIQALKLDPFFLPNFTTAFTDRIRILGNVRGVAKFSEGKLSGLSRVQRKGNCSGPDYVHGAYVIGCTLVLNNLQAVHKGRMKYSFLPTLPIKAKANMTETSIFVEIASYVQDPQPVMKSFNFKKYGEIHPRFTGLGSTFNRYLIVLDSGYREKIDSSLYAAIGQSFQYALSRAISGTVASSSVVCYEGYEPCVCVDCFNSK